MVRLVLTAALRPTPWPRRALLVALTLLFGAGCRSTCDQVERELRTREIEVRELHEQLDHVEAHNRALQNELRSQRGDPILPDTHAAPAGLAYPAVSLTLGRQTGGYDGDGKPGDEALQVVIEPRDRDNHVVKVPALAEICVAEITPEGAKKPLSTWQVGDDDLRKTWRSGLLTTGFFVVLPWKVWPESTRLRVTVRLILPDGRAYEADRDVTIKLPIGRPMPPAEPIEPKPPAQPMPPGGPVEPKPPPTTPTPPAPPTPPREGPVLPPPTPLPPGSTGWFRWPWHHQEKAKEKEVVRAWWDGPGPASGGAAPATGKETTVSALGSRTVWSGTPREPTVALRPQANPLPTDPLPTVPTAPLEPPADAGTPTVSAVPAVQLLGPQPLR